MIARIRNTRNYSQYSFDASISSDARIYDGLLPTMLPSPRPTPRARRPSDHEYEGCTQNQRSCEYTQKAIITADHGAFLGS
jgi:hypothetical protein